ncbi:glutathione S-transferase [Leptodontidium sp. MPI-SDFR-AT-0119]|nr:glutathione S-transferase [Leptodontidium sp. MPI-SDFR-AT-0119]
MSSTKPHHEAGTADGWHGVISPGGPFPPEVGRYHLYIGLFCPFAHRANLVRHLRGLAEVLPISIVKPYPKGDSKGWPGWRFPKDDNEYEGSTVDHLFGSEFMHEIYFRADKEYKGRYSVPLIWDKKTGTIVNNESAEILRWLPTAFDTIVPPPSGQTLDLYPATLAKEIDELSSWLQSELNGGVYRAGFVDTQEQYEVGCKAVFHALNKLEKLIKAKGGPFLLGGQLTELDLRAYPTLVRFDTVYVQHFKVNLGTLRHNYPVIHNYLKHLYWNVPGFSESTDFRHIKENYTKSHYDINPKAITPLGPLPDVESNVEEDYSKLPIGYVEVPE